MQWDEVTRGSDIVVILEINGVKVGITTLGDPVPDMEPNLIYLAKQGCYVIVCATRTRGKTTAAVDRLRQNQYEIVWIEKRRIGAPSDPPTRQQEADSNERARFIVEQVDSAISEVTAI